jgi:DNA (cytosine-5)-methyltransferase 1
MALSLFSGCGGDTLGLERCGLKVLAFSEISNTYSSSHISNFPNSVRILPGDVSKIEDSEFQKYKDLIDVLFAGFPCQGFSRAGKKDPEDPRNRLYLQFVRAAKNVRPLFILGENVKGLETMRSGPKNEDPLIIDLIRQEFAAIGYSIMFKTWETTELGVPQKRKRVIIVGWDTERITSFPSNFWDLIDRTPSPLTIRSFVSNSMEGAYRIPDESIPANFENFSLEISDDATPLGTPHPYVVLKANQNLLSCKKRDSPIHSEIIDLDAPAKTIICTYAHQPRLLVGLRKRNGESYARTLFPDELKQIQGFPANYIINGSIKDKITQIGNAAPPPMIERVVRALLKIKT